MRLRTFEIAVALGIVAHALAAQTPTIPAGTNIPIPYRTYVGLDPLGIPFDIGSIEVESAVASGITLGGVASYTDEGDSRFTTGDVKLRYYPGEVVLRGFSVGVSAGLTRYTNTYGFDGTRQSLDAPTLGVIVDYNWLLGTRKRFVVGTGVGAKRVLASATDRDRVGMDRAYVTGRFIIGIAF